MRYDYFCRACGALLTSHDLEGITLEVCTTDGAVLNAAQACFCERCQAKRMTYDGEARVCRECGKPLTFSEWQNNTLLIGPEGVENEPWAWVCDRCRTPRPCDSCGRPLTRDEELNVTRLRKSSESARSATDAATRRSGRGALQQWKISEVLTCLQEYESVQLAVNIPSSRSGQDIYP